MKIVLIDPPGNMTGKNSGLAYLAASLKLDKHKIKVIDINNKRENAEQRILDACKDTDWIGVSVKSFTIEQTKKIIELIRNNEITAPIVVGGVHITLDGKKFLEENPDIDYGLCGDAELTFRELVSGKSFEKIQGLIYRKEGKVIQNDLIDLVDIKKLPFPDYSDFDSGPPNNYPLITSRGCVYNCIYCSVPKIYNKRWRFREPDDIVAELKSIPQKHFHILDDNFTFNMDRAKEICRRIINAKLDKTWDCDNGVRADKLDEELVSLMKKAGCIRISLGIESMHPEVFKAIKKGEEIEDLIRAFKLLQKYNFDVKGFIIIGLPFSSYERDLYTVNQLVKYKINAWANNLVLYPHTEARDIVLNMPNYYKMLEDYTNKKTIGDKPTITFETPDYPASKRLKMYYIANLRLGNYFLFSYGRSLKGIIILLWRIFRYDFFYSHKHLYNIFSIAFKKIYNKKYRNLFI